jgi:hypothetical protein
VLREADEHNSYDPLVSVNREGGDKQAALVAARKLAEALAILPKPGSSR